jgi:flagellar biosynthesis chaperone FliJ
MSLECHSKVNETQRDCHQRLSAAFDQHKKREDDLLQQLERLRQEKDQVIRNIALEKEQQRNAYETKIHELELIIRRQEHSIVELRSVVLELRTILKQKEDVED